MEITLSPELKKFVDAKIEAGYGSANDVVKNALQLWLRNEQGDSIRGDELTRLIAVGQAEADRGELLDGPAVFTDLRRHSEVRRGKVG
jgi:antitoxin ParD1/3/4